MMIVVALVWGIGVNVEGLAMADVAAVEERCEDAGRAWEIRKSMWLSKSGCR